MGQSKKKLAEGINYLFSITMGVAEETLILLNVYKDDNIIKRKLIEADRMMDDLLRKINEYGSELFNLNQLDPETLLNFNLCISSITSLINRAYKVTETKNN